MYFKKKNGYHHEHDYNNRNCNCGLSHAGIIIDYFHIFDFTEVVDHVTSYDIQYPDIIFDLRFSCI